MNATPVGYAGNDAFEQRKKKRSSPRPVRTVLAKNKGRKGRTYAAVYNDANARTAGGLRKQDIVRVSVGGGRYRYVSHARRMAAKRAYASRDSAIKRWNRAVKAITGSAQVIRKDHPDYSEVKREYRSY